MWARRSGKLGENTTCHQSVAMKRPWPSKAKATGCCIQLLAEVIQNAEIRVPKATIQVAVKCRPGPTFFQPSSITPRNEASRKKAVSTS